MRMLYGLRVTDLGPYRAIKTDLLRALDMREMTYGWPTEMMVKAARQHARILEVPVSYHLRRAGRSKVARHTARYSARRVLYSRRDTSILENLLLLKIGSGELTSLTSFRYSCRMVNSRAYALAGIMPVDRCSAGMQLHATQQVRTGL